MLLQPNPVLLLPPHPNFTRRGLEDHGLEDSGLEENENMGVFNLSIYVV